MKKINFIVLNSEPENIKAEQEIKLLQEFSRFQLTGKSPDFLKTISLIKQISSCNTAALIQGETGTGKENAARAIHYLSDRRDYGFIQINCAAIADELLESELFGHEKGALVHAKAKQHGLISLAQCGTLFLDEVDRLTPKAQTSLLIFLQTQEYRPVGSKVTLQADVRILSSTNVDLGILVEQKKFRKDLYLHLNKWNLEMPALRNRRQDIPLIAAALIEKFSQQYRTDIKKLDPPSIHYLMQQPWIGNIRELENTLLHNFLLCGDSTLSIKNTQFSEEDEFVCSVPNNTNHDKDQDTNPTHETPINSANSTNPTQLNYQDAKAQAICDFEEHYLKELMAMADDSSAAARFSGKERRALGKLLQKHYMQKNGSHTITH